MALKLHAALKPKAQLRANQRLLVRHLVASEQEDKGIHPRSTSLKQFQNSLQKRPHPTHMGAVHNLLHTMRSQEKLLLGA